MPGFGELRETEARWRRFPGLERLEPAAGRFELTFDDGPDPDATPAVLDALDAAGATGTFFLVGEQVEAHPQLARELAERGHALALHGHRTSSTTACPTPPPTWPAAPSWWRPPPA